MEFKSVVGWRRSIRFFEPWRAVEREKVQCILEAIYRAPRVLEVDFVRVLVVERDRLAPAQMQALKTPTTTAQLDMAPVYVFFYADVSMLESALDGANFRELIRLGVLNPSHGWDERFVSETAIPYLRALVEDQDRAPLRPPSAGEGTGPMVSRETLRLARTAIGIAQEYALLAAFDQGLAAQLSGVSVNAARTILGIPDTWIPSSPMLLGYHGESREAGGQRPREPFEEDFFELRHPHPFYREPAVVERLTAAEMIQAPAPFSWRMNEVRGLARKFGLPE
ncbi:MAG: nitroreductase family protein [Dehalococcoidia bacterium]|nr:nitroreductase family protein [Dehalococcoidia bacterium]